MSKTPNSDMLVESGNTRQIPNEPRRRWFTSRKLDLIVWFDEAGAPVSFQFCYDKPVREHALTWKPGTGFRHTAIDDGESGGGLGHKGSPVVGGETPVDANKVAALFDAASVDLPADIVEFVSWRLRQHPGFDARAAK